MAGDTKSERGYRRTGARDETARRAAVAALLVLTVVPALTVAARGAEPDGAGRQATSTPFDPEAAAIHLLNRATHGVILSDVDRIMALGREAWLDEQLHPARIDDADFEGRLTSYPAAGMTPDELFAKYPPPQVLRGRGNADSASQAERRRQRREMGVQGPARILFDLTGARIERAVGSERQLEAVMTDFWFNHFNVFFGKAADRWLVADYEKTAIRPHVFGRFEDMLTATASHPAMLFYLDNWQSTAPDSLNATSRTRDRALRRWRGLTDSQRKRLRRSGRVTREQVEALEGGPGGRPQRGGRASGINENYARELLELHTLGVDGGYTQEDVLETARAFTGWTITRPRPTDRLVAGGNLGSVDFAYRQEIHYRGDRSVLGRRIESGEMEQGRQILSMLARHPSTARHIASKLAQSFAADDPPEGLVDELTDVFLRTDGDLREVTRALFTSERFYDPEIQGSKLKSPFELVTSALRATDARVAPSRGLFETLRGMDHVPYLSSAPTGYPETSADWTSGGALLQRMNFGLALAADRLPNVRVGLMPRAEEPADYVDEVLTTLLPGRNTDTLAEAILADLASAGIGEPGGRDRAADTSRQAWVRALGLALGSPEFQHH